MLSTSASQTAEYQNRDPETRSILVTSLERCGQNNHLSQFTPILIALAISFPNPTSSPRLPISKALFPPLPQIHLLSLLHLHQSALSSILPRHYQEWGADTPRSSINLAVKMTTEHVQTLFFQKLINWPTLRGFLQKWQNPPPTTTKCHVSDPKHGVKEDYDYSFSKKRSPESLNIGKIWFSPSLSLGTAETLMVKIKKSSLRYPSWETSTQVI